MDLDLFANGPLDVKKSLEIRTGDGGRLTASTWHDYVSALKESGQVQDESELFSGLTWALPEIYFHWISQTQIGCLFAVHLANRHEQARWKPLVLDPQADDMVEILNSLLDAAVTEQAEACIVIFSARLNDNEIVSLINKLCSSPRWYWTDNGLDDDSESHPETKLVGLRWIFPTPSHVAHVVGFHDSTCMPITRRGPLPALVIRTSANKRSESKIGQEDGRDVAHLADMDSLLSTHDENSKFWTGTKKLKKKLIDETFSKAARARVTFSLPQTIAGKLVKCKVVKIQSGEISSGTA